MPTCSVLKDNIIQLQVIVSKTTRSNGTLQVQQLAEFPANSKNVIFSQDGQQLATVEFDGTANKVL